MKREYHKWFSPRLNKNMELLVFGHAGAKVLFFPPRMGRFYDYENWRVVLALKTKIEAGHIQLYCVDSVDTEAFYNTHNHPKQKIERHLAYESYILHEVIPFMKNNSPNPNIIAAGCSLGAYHAVNLALKHPHLFCKVVGMSGRYDLTISKSYFRNLLDGYHDENVYFNMPTQYLQNVTDETYIKAINKMDIVLVIGKQDLFLENNYKLKRILEEKNISHTFYTWDSEAHKAYYWRRMVPLYI